MNKSNDPPSESEIFENILGSAEIPQKSAEEENSIAIAAKEARKLCEQLNSEYFEVSPWLEAVKKYSENKDNRLLYFAISDYIFGLEQRDHVTAHITEAVSCVLQENSGYEHATRKMTMKLYDHINLAIRQKEMFNKNEADLRKQIDDIVTPKIELKSALLTKEMTGQLIGLIAIFTALSFIVFGGISSLDSIFQSLQSTMDDKNTVLPTLIVTVAWALCLMNLLFGFMYFVLRIAGLNYSDSQSAGKNLVQRYPVVFFCDYVLLLLLVLFGGAWFAECNGVGKDIFDFWVIKNQTLLFYGSIVAICFVFAKAWKKGKSLYNSTSSQKDDSQKPE